MRALCILGLIVAGSSAALSADSSEHAVSVPGTFIRTIDGGTPDEVTMIFVPTQELCADAGHLTPQQQDDCYFASASGASYVGYSLDKKSHAAL